MPFIPSAENLLTMRLYLEEGYGNLDIADRLNCSLSVVKKYRKRLADEPHVNLQDRRKGNIRNQKFC